MVIKAVFENGVLRPLEPLALDEHECVEVQVHRKCVQPVAGCANDIERLWQRWGKGRFGMPSGDFDDIPEGFKDLLE